VIISRRTGHPEGKTLEGIEVRTLEVFEKRDPVPGFVNVFHATTRHHVVTREVLLEIGKPWQRALVEETARNLRALLQLSLVLCIPLRGSTPDKVKLLVITKDVWSLRINSDFTFVAGRIENLVLQAAEWNVLGLHQLVTTQTRIEPEAYSVGGGYTVPWVLGHRLQAGVDGNVIISRRTGHPEGSYGTVSVGQPLFSARTEWAWQVRGTWDDEITRRYVNGQLSYFQAKPTFDAAQDLWNYSDQASKFRVPFQYRTGVYTATANATRSWGWATKHDLNFGMEASSRDYHTGDVSGVAPSAVDEFAAKVLPVRDTRVGPFIEMRAYKSDYIRALDVEILALQEDFRLGHDLIARFYPVLKALGASRDLIGMRAAAQYTVPLHDGFARGNVSVTVEPEPDGHVDDGRVESRVRIVSPRMPIGRLIFDAQLIHRFRNYLNRITYLGGESRLRGYPTNYTYGKDLVAYTTEFRSRPVEILSVQIAAGLFYDTGDAFDGLSDLRLKHSVGGGLRVFVPQLNKTIYRVDVGFPVERGGLPAGVPSWNLLFTVSQAFSVPSILQTTITP
jgi:hypothetical protein